VSWNEDNLHRWLAKREVPAILCGSPGHDAAVLHPAPGRPVICADQTIEGVHFDSGARAGDVGRKAANRALSDLAATAALPSSLVLTICAAERVEAAWLRRLIESVSQAAQAVGAELVGGDMAMAEGPTVISVTACGVLPGKRRAPGRDRARAGQQVVLTGAVGGSRARRHLRFEPRIELGRQLFELGATAMMDVSDGLAWDLYRLARASKVAIHLEHVPIHPDAKKATQKSGRKALDHALHDGEDHELIACLRDAVNLPAPTVAIGKVKRGSGLWLAPKLTGEEQAIEWNRSSGGWTHGL
jgi:thiamine-monophosphate kinase